jgi:hypothetical protein
MKVTIIDNFISDKQIEFCLNFYKHNIHLRKKWRDTFPIGITGFLKT